MRLPLHIGLDDTDSTLMGCTTYIASLLVEKLADRDGVFLDYPNLIRLNPNIPWKTRGNGAVCLRIRIPEDRIDEAMEGVVETVEANSDLDCGKTDPGIVFFPGERIPKELSDFSKRVEQDVVGKHEALELVRRFNAEAFAFKDGRGIIGALAAIGETLVGDHTYELIAYRVERNRGTPRRLDEASVFRMDKVMKGLTFNNVDYEKRGVLVTPRGPDPVLLGIRGESPWAVKMACGLVKVQEEVERWVVFRTNQGTDAHLRRRERISQIKPYRPVITVGSLSRKPKSIPGRHVIFTIGDDSGQIDCAAYEPTGRFRNIVRELTIGDLLEVYGGVRPASERNPMTINLEKMRIISLVPKVSTGNPVCKFCGKRMESMGRGKGFRCKRCGLRERKAEKVHFQMKRDVSEGLYIPPPRANRHLTKPLSRYGLEKKFEGRVPLEFWNLGLNGISISP
jgi:tRNA(Ile2)-agmatinylcytidine synthase